MLALEIGKHISPDCTVVYIRQQRSRKGEIASTPKTDAGYRDVDLHPLVAKMLREYIGNRRSGFLLETETGNMLWPSTLYRDGLKTILEGIGRSKVRFHAFRRFRQAVLERSEVRQLLIDFWLGHDNSDMASRYAKQLTEDMEFRQEWAERVGLGFVLPEVSEKEQSRICSRRISLHAHPRVGGVLNRPANSNDFTWLYFLDGQTAGGKVLAEVLEAIGRRMEDHDGDTATLHILLVANIRITLISTSNSGSAAARSSPFCFPDHLAS